MKALILFSGGIDSTTCLAMAIEKYGRENVIALSTLYGQKHTKELKAARDIAPYKMTSQSLESAILAATDKNNPFLKGT